LFAVADDAPQLFLALRCGSARVADSSQTAGDLQLVNRDTPLGGYSEDVVKKRPDGDVEQMSISQRLDLHRCVPGEVMLEDDVPWIETRGLASRLPDLDLVPDYQRGTDTCDYDS
jgi:hypothetical protein